MPKQKESKELEKVEEPRGLILQGDPDQQIEYGSRAAKALAKVIDSKPKKVVIGGKKYVEFEDWQTVARFYGATVGIEWTRKIERDDGALLGYEARAVVHQGGQIISAAEAMCMRDELNWSNRPEFMLRSMAQTRASAKALRNVFAWIIVLAGYQPTPAEEMDGLQNELDAKEEGRLVQRKEMRTMKNTTTKALIMGKVKQLHPDPLPTRKDWEQAIKELSGLDPTDENMSEINSRLSVLIREKQSKNLSVDRF